ncbi:MAG: YbaK/EbsC family protein [Patescibacteria group bacterium]|nr:YbaK/EbsC family protein [Patescibacteria group bacterium]MDD4304365.1 YbaK/EbsC family protein [Patescibacteria group bacterium]MDD4695388.1 YbaK/EbsC family protein [Patescibacteria group bacterium]
MDKKIINHIQKTNLKHEIVPHKKVYTSYDASQTLKVHPKQIVKSLIVKVKNNFALVLLSADKNIDFKKLAKQFGAKEIDIKIPKEKVLMEKLGIKPGTAHVFGDIYKIPVVVEYELSKLKDAIFSSGSLTESLKIKVSDFVKHQEASVAKFGITKKFKKIKKILVRRNLSGGGKKVIKPKKNAKKPIKKIKKKVTQKKKIVKKITKKVKK